MKAAVERRPETTPAAGRRANPVRRSSREAAGHDAGLPRFLGGPGVPEAEIPVGAPDDPLEAEADAFAKLVMGAGGEAGAGGEPPPPVRLSRDTGAVRRACSSCASAGPLEELLPVRRCAACGSRSAGGGLCPACTARAIRQPRGGRPLPAETRGELEPSLGIDLSPVRVHDDPAAGRLAASLDARAFTHGDHIWLGAGERVSDRRLVAHEVAHVAQQRGTPTVARPVRRSAWYEDLASGAADVASSAYDTTAEGAGDLYDAGAAGAGAVYDTAAAGAEAAVEWGSDRVLDLLRQVAPGLADLVERGPFEVIKEKIAGVVGGWIESLRERIDLGGSLTALSTWIGGVLGGAGASLSGAVAGSCSGLADLLGGLLEMAKAFYESDFFTGLKARLFKVQDAVAAVVQLFVEAEIRKITAVWGFVTGFADTLGEWIGWVRDAASEAWDWVAEKLGLGGAGGGGAGGGLVEWVSEKASEVWEWVKSDVAPAVWEGVAALGQAIYRFSGLEALVTLGQKAGELIGALAWLWEHKDDPDLLVNARQDPAVANTFLPGLIESARGFGASLESALAWLTETAGKIATGVLAVVGALAGLPILGAASQLFSGFQESVASFRDWAAEKLAQATETISSGLATLWSYVRPIVSVIALLLASWAVPGGFPIALAALVGAGAWLLLPDCFKASIIDFILDMALLVLRSAPDLPLFGPLWSLLKPGVIGFLARMKSRSPEEKIEVSEKVAKILLASGLEFVVGFVLGVLKGVWEGLTDPFVMIYQGIMMLPQVASWFVRAAGPLFGQPVPAAAPPPVPAPVETGGETVDEASVGEGSVDELSAAAAAGSATGTAPATATATATATADDAELGEAFVRLAGDVRPPMEVAAENFMDAVEEHFEASGAPSFDTLWEKLGELWASGQAAVEEKGAEFADQTVDALLAPGAVGAGAAMVGKLGGMLGWLTGTIAIEVAIAYFTAGTVTAAKGVMKAVVLLAKVIDKIGDFLGPILRVLGKLAKWAKKLVGGIVKMVGGAAKGAVKKVVEAVKAIASRVGRFVDEMAGTAAGRARRADAPTPRTRADAPTPRTRADAPAPRVEGPDRQRLLESSGAKEGPTLTPREKQAELSWVDDHMGQARPSPHSNYTREVDLPNGHTVREGELGQLCRFSGEGFLLRPGRSPAELIAGFTEIPSLSMDLQMTEGGIWVPGNQIHLELDSIEAALRSRFEAAGQFAIDPKTGRPKGRNLAAAQVGLVVESEGKFHLLEARPDTGFQSGSTKLAGVEGVTAVDVDDLRAPKRGLPAADLLDRSRLYPSGHWHSEQGFLQWMRRNPDLVAEALSRTDLKNPVAKAMVIDIFTTRYACSQCAKMAIVSANFPPAFNAEFVEQLKKRGVGVGGDLLDTRVRISGEHRFPYNKKMAGPVDWDRMVRGMGSELAIGDISVIEMAEGRAPRSRAVFDLGGANDFARVQGELNDLSAERQKAAASGQVADRMSCPIPKR